MQRRFRRCARGHFRHCRTITAASAVSSRVGAAYAIVVGARCVRPRAPSPTLRAARDYGFRARASGAPRNDDRGVPSCCPGSRLFARGQSRFQASHIGGARSAGTRKLRVGNGAAEGIRTPDPRFTKAVLYRLSYCGPLLLEHDRFRKPVSTPDQARGRLFRDHALGRSDIGCACPWQGRQPPVLERIPIGSNRDAL